MGNGVMREAVPLLPIALAPAEKERSEEGRSAWGGSKNGEEDPIWVVSKGTMGRRGFP